MEKKQKLTLLLLLFVFIVVIFFIYHYFSGNDLAPIFDPKLFDSLPLVSWISTQNKTNDLVSNLPNSAINAGIATAAAPVTLISNGVTSSMKNSDASANIFKSSKVTLNIKKSDSSPKNVSSSDPTFKAPKKSSGNKTLPLCPLVPPNLVGPLATYKTGKEFSEIAKDNPGLKQGGLFSPSNCKSRHRVAIIIPYRNREGHLKIFLNNIHPFLQRQQLEYGIYVIDQALPGKFNRATLLNIGWVEALKRHDYQCAVFHDVDLIPENDRNIYSCPEQPRHMSAAIDKHNYQLPYQTIFGGVSALRKDHFEKINGFSNLYFGWGGEDDDMELRIRKAKLEVIRYPMDVARYKMIKHNRDAHNEANPKKSSLLRKATGRMEKDGLNSLKYTVKNVDLQPTHTRIEVLIDEKLMLQGQHF